MEKVIFDSNAYRYLVKGKKYNEIDKVVKNLKTKEAKRNITSLMSSTVAKELLAHVANKNDKSYDKCMNAVKAMYLHSSNNDYYNMMASPELLIAKVFFNYEIKSKIETNKAIAQILYHLSKNKSDHTIKRFQHNLNQNRKHVENSEEIFANTLKDFVINNGGTSNGWQIHPNNPIQRQKVLKDLRSKKSSISMALGYLTITLEQIRIENPELAKSFSSESLLDMAEKFIDIFIEPILLFKQVFEYLVNSKFNISENSRANFVWDIHLMFNVGNKKLTDGSHLYFITSDKEIIRTATKGNGRLSVLTFDEYIDYLN